MRPFQGRTVAIIIALGLMFYDAVANGQEGFQVMGCCTGKIVVLSETKSLTVYTMVGEGEAWGTQGAVTFKDMKWVFTATMRTVDDHSIGIGYCKFIDPDGNYFILEATGDAISKGGEWKFLHGTGKWSRLEGELGGRVIFQGRPLEMETEKYWCRIIGTLNLPR